MSLPIEHHADPVGQEGGGAPGGIAVLSVSSLEIPSLEQFVEWMRLCERCESEQIFRAGWQCAAGLVGCCLGCGAERVVPFSRSSAEAA